MAAVLVEPLAPHHLEGFATTFPMGPIPDAQWGQAAAFVRDGEVLAICGVWKSADAAEIGLVLSTSARRYPVTLHKMAIQMINGLHLLGHEKLRAWATGEVPSKWLYRLGFGPSETGAFERCQSR